MDVSPFSAWSAAISYNKLSSRDVSGCEPVCDTCQPRITSSYNAKETYCEVVPKLHRSHTILEGSSTKWILSQDLCVRCAPRPATPTHRRLATVRQNERMQNMVRLEFNSKTITRLTSGDDAPVGVARLCSRRAESFPLPPVTGRSTPPPPAAATREVALAESELRWPVTISGE